jgi:uncharacterized protein
MQMSGDYTLAASPDAVWRALNDPDILRRCIPGCQALEKLSDTEFKATVGMKIGPLQATFNGQVQLSDLNPPTSYTLSGSGSGGMVGGGKGRARVRLEPEGPATTRLSYEVDADVTGKIAQLGSRLIDSTAKMLAGQFFDTFATIVQQPAEMAADAGEGATASTVKSSTTPASLGLPVWLWLAIGAAAVAIAGLVLGR